MILVCGEALYDVFFASEAETGFMLDARIGGSAFNVAVGLARLGQEVALLTGISTDRTGRKLVASLAREGVETKHLAMKDAPTTLALVELTDDGSARYTFRGEGAADRLVTAEDVPDLGHVAALVFGCFSLLTTPTGDTFLSMASDPRPIKVLDPNIRPTVEPDMEVWRTRVEAFAAHADIIKISEEDIGLLYPDAPFDPIARRWLERGAALVALTRGSEGAHVVTRKGAVDVPSERVEVVDTVGAGDSFLAALLTGLADLDLLARDKVGTVGPEAAERVTRFAARAAALTCARRGADAPRREALYDGSV